MKKLILLSSFFTLLLSCNKPTSQLAYQRTGEVVCVGHDDRQMQIQAKAVGSSLQDAAYYADVSTFENILYKGVPNSNQEHPLVEDSKRNAETDQFFTAFFDSGKYLEYITDQRVTGHDQSGGNHFVEKNITIDLLALRKYLEREKIIRKFGIE